MVALGTLDEAALERLQDTLGARLTILGTGGPEARPARHEAKALGVAAERTGRARPGPGVVGSRGMSHVRLHR